MDEDLKAAVAAFQERLEEQLDRLHGRYGLALERDGLEFLVDPRLLWKPPRVLVRGVDASAEVWLWEDDISFVGPTDFPAADQDRILALVRDHLEELLNTWYNLREDMRRGRLGRNLLVD